MNPLDWDLGNVPPGILWGGVDEAGRGAWAGPVVAACAVLDQEAARKWRHVLVEVQDSKKLSPERRAVLATELKSVLAGWAVAEVDAMGIDRENILEATMMAMRGAVEKVKAKPRILFVDGNRAPKTGLLERLIVDGDATSCAVAAASILAKTHRDARMVALDAQYEGYGFAQHKGYGTELHRERLAARGISPVHRLSFAPVEALQVVDEGLREQLLHSLERCASVMELHCWVEVNLRPAYPKLKRVWIETLRRRYADMLARLAYEEELGGAAGEGPGA
jgi:ribonuclease HII